MKKQKLLRQSVKLFFKNWGAYVTLVIVLNLIISAILVPLMEYSTSLILQYNGVPYISYTNVGWLLTTKPVAVLELLALLVILFALVFWQFAFLVSGIDNISRHHNQTFWQIAGHAVSQMAHLRFGSFLFFTIYFILVLPFSNVYLSSPLLSKVAIPTFILETVTKNAWLEILLAAVAILVLYIGIRLTLVLPLMILKRQRGFEAAGNSWAMTRHRTWGYMWRLMMLGVISLASTTLLSVGLYFLQTYLDHQSSGIAFTGAVINMGLLVIWQRLIASFSLVVFMLMLILAIRDDNVAQIKTPAKLPSKRKWGRRFIAASLIVIFLLSEVIYNAQYLQGALLNQPLTISHRGVDDGNGVQNTIPALNRTSREHPNFVEMDIHETKDHQFVVMHDENLANLAGVNAAPYQLTLQQMTSMKVHENGYTAHIASFDQYLRAAERDHQRLLVEIKTTSHDSPNMLQLFIHRYERRLLHDHDQIHSLDYHVISGLKKHAPKLFVSYILPYNFSFPETKANAYTMEETTLNSQFVSEAHRRNQWVYAWTVDDSDDMTKMLFLNVDGIITDNLSELQATIKSTFNHPSYAQRLLIYSNELQNESPTN